MMEEITDWKESTNKRCDKKNLKNQLNDFQRKFQEKIKKIVKEFDKLEMMIHNYKMNM